MANYNISGTISGSLSGVIVTAGGKSGTSSGGSYTISAVPEGLVYVVPSLAGYSFSPPLYVFTLAGDTTNINFTATAESLFSTNFHLRTKNAAGSVLATFSPATDLFIKRVEPGVGEADQLERVDVNHKTDNYILGFKQVVKVTLADASGYKYIRAAGGYSTLEAVLNSVVAGAVFEYNIIDASAAGSNWVPCELVKIDNQKIKDKNIGVQKNLEFISKDFVAASFPVS